MKFYLQTISSDEFMEINQAIGMEGIITQPWDFTRCGADVNKTLSALLDVMSEEQKLYVQAIQAGFRGMLEEARKLRQFSSQLVAILPCSEQGLMAMKALRRMQLPAAAGQIFQAEQAMLAMHNLDGPVLLDLEKIGRFADAKEVLANALALAQKPENILCLCSSLEQMRMAMALGAKQIAAPAGVYQQMLFSVLTSSETNSMREEWILTYTRNEVLE